MTSLSLRLIGAFSLLLLLVAQPAFAQTGAEASLTPSSSSVKTGDFFTVSVFVDPNGHSIDTVRLELQFSSDILAAQAAAPSSALPYASPGNTMDNAKGEISLGAFTLGNALASEDQVAKITFKALKAGTGKVALLSSSLLLEDGENVSVGSGSEINVTVTENASSAPTGTGTSTPPSSGEIPAATNLGSGTLSVSSSTHPDTTVWYASRTVKFFWTAEGATIKSCSGVFDESPDTKVSASLPKFTDSEATFTADHDGVWYFHLSCTDTKGNVSATTTFQVRIDATPPVSVTLDPDSTQFFVGEDLNISFGARDEMSGIAEYALSLNGGDYTSAESPFTLKNLPLGDTLIALRATDLAGNSTYANVRVRAYDENSPFGKFLSFSRSFMKEPLNILSLAAVTMGILLGFCGILLVFVLLKRKLKQRI